MVLDKLHNAITAKFVGGSAAAALTTAFAGRFWWEQARWSTALPKAFPYVVAEQPAGMASSESFGALSAGMQSNEPLILFKVIGEGKTAVAAHMATLEGVFNDVLLTLTGGTCIGCWREGEPTPLPLGDDTDGSDVWQWAIMYRYAIQ